MTDPLLGLYAITAPELSQEQLLPHVQAALEGGARVVQYRDKTATRIERLRRAQDLLALCREFRRPLIINDDLDLCVRIHADGVHLGRSDGSLVLARQRLDPAAIVGATCHDSLAMAQEARQAGATYCAFGRFFDSHTKSSAPPAPLSVLTRARHELDLPIVAIGGIGLDNAQSVISAGAAMIAVIHHLFALADPRQTAIIRQRAQALSQLFEPPLQTKE